MKLSVNKRKQDSQHTPAKLNYKMLLTASKYNYESKIKRIRNTEQKTC